MHDKEHEEWLLNERARKEAIRKRIAPKSTPPKEDDGRARMEVLKKEDDDEDDEDIDENKDDKDESEGS